jgi:hypothetical protein|tara:strand:+ start:66 stop:344 length:279 start_codon:yes stop_codon:yes gene_type:complete
MTSKKQEVDRFRQYCLLVKAEDGSVGVFGEFENPKEAAEYYKYFLSHAVDEADVTVQVLTMVTRLNDEGNAYVVDPEFLEHPPEEPVVLEKV